MEMNNNSKFQHNMPARKWIEVGTKTKLERCLINNSEDLLCIRDAPFQTY